MRKIISRHKADLLARLHRALREFPRYNQFLDKANGMMLSPPESHILVEVGGRDRFEFSQLVAALGLEKTAVSKLINGLCRQGSLRSSPSMRDRRGRDLSLTTRGEATLRQFDQLANERLNEFDRIGCFSSGELKKLSCTLTDLASALEAPETVRRDEDHILRPAIRRLTRSFQLLGRRALGSELNTLEWQLLLSVCENSTSFTPSELSRQLGTSKSALAIALAALEQQRLISRIQQKHDGRVYLLSARPEAYRLIAKIEQNAVMRFAALATIDQTQVESVERWIRAAAFYYHIRRQEREVRVLSSEADIEQARRAAVAMYLAAPEQFQMPAALFPKSSRSFGLYEGGIMISAVEFEQGSTLRVQNLYARSNFSSEALRAFVAYAAKPLMTAQHVSTGSTFAHLLAPDPRVTTALGRLFGEE
jgi:DNA-binding MarR family transcriptional regulator